MNKFPMKLPAIKVEQPLGDFYVVSIPAEILLDVCYTIRAEILDGFEEQPIKHVGKFINKLIGNQRIVARSRLDEIKRYTETVDASFPNSIILGVNYSSDGTLVTDVAVRWDIEQKDNGFYYLTIPTGEKLASIIDGQHRVFGFENSNCKDMELLCSVYLDLPLAYHGRIFTNININQRRVDKNLAYNLFQFDMEQGESSSWSPETLAVYFSRVLSEDEDSPLRGKIKLGVVNGGSNSTISMASIIDGILSLITSNPKADRDILQTKRVSDGRDRNMLLNISSKAPLRELYLNNKDKTLFDIILNFLESVVNHLWKFNVFKKTLGIQACFDFLRGICEDNGYSHLDIDSMLEKASFVNFDDPFFGVQSKLRVRIKNILIVASGMKMLDELNIKNEEDYLEYKRLLADI
ncbi:DGQHR domain-containing protein [Proteus vulgaris]|uniref:DGQHR domain-containing protein n=1 Tax=Proteus vulgaris TaxID=585 RepID=UPI002554C3CE|nr:DGQHR domain-containing protein [Proteus vulgaris]GLX65304.1 DGQHR domain-containing protein [Proteus vulgaris]